VHLLAKRSLSKCTVKQQLKVYCYIHKRLFWTFASAIHSAHLPTTVLEVGGGYWDDRLRGKCSEGKVLTMTN
jgi:hypothetical protein